jgi:SAM-dependent methyltransferase
VTTETTTATSTDTDSAVHDAVRDRYAEAARAASALSRQSTAQSSCCGPDGSQAFGEILYAGTEIGNLPEAARLASLGCGNPIAVADLHPGETVLDLGSGGGIDVLLSAQRVGPTGRAIGLDMTDEMLELARRNAAEAGATNVEFVKGTIESMPVAADSVDVVISNCVINLAADKGAVFREIARVLRPGGRVGVSDVVANDELTVEDRTERGSYAGCIAGALSFGEYRAGLEAVGLAGISIEPTHPVADGLFSAIVRATKPADWTAAAIREPSVRLPLPTIAEASTGSDCCGGICC